MKKETISSLKEEKEIVYWFLEDRRREHKIPELEKETDKNFNNQILPLLHKYRIFQGMQPDDETVTIKTKNLENALDRIENRIQKIELLEHQKKLNRSIEQLVEGSTRLIEKFEKASSSSEKNARRLVYFTAGLVVVTFLLILSNHFSTQELIKSNEYLMQQQIKMLAPKLNFIKLDETQYNVTRDRLVQETGWDEYIRICVRNDGRSNTGRIRFEGSDDGVIKTQTTVISDNLAPGESNCTSIGIGSFWCLDDPDECTRAKKNIPLGYREIKMKVTCWYCDQDPTITVKLLIKD